MDSLIFTQPDQKFNVAVATFPASGRPFYIFASTTDPRTVAAAPWRKVGGAGAVVVGDVGDALKGLLLDYTNVQLKEMLGLHPATIAALRRFVGLEDGRGKARWK